MARQAKKKTYTAAGLDGRMSQGRFAWVRTYLGQWAIMRYQHHPDKERGTSIILTLPRPGFSKPLMLNFTALTHEEFVEVKKFFNLLFDQAEPIIIERDKVAQDAFDAGDDSYVRCYRQTPQFIVREGAIAPYFEGIRLGSEGVSSGHGEAGDQPGGVREPSSEVAEREPEDRGPEDDESQAD